MIIKEDIRKRTNALMANTTNTNADSTKSFIVHKAIQTHSQLKRKWVLLHKKSQLNLQNVLAFFRDITISMNEISHVQSALKEPQNISPQELKVLTHTLKKLELLKLKTRKTLSELFIFQWFEKAELFYFITKQQKLLSQEINHFSENTSFWDILSHVLQNALKWALNDVQKHLTNDGPYVFQDLIVYVSHSLEDFVIKTHTQINRINRLNTICAESHGRFLRFFNQNTHPYATAMDIACLGISFVWAEQLHNKTPTQIGLHSKHFSELRPLFQFIKKENKRKQSEGSLEKRIKQNSDDILPQTWPLTYLRFGESDYTFKSVGYQIKGFLYLHRDQMPTAAFERIHGGEIAAKALQLFSLDAKISTLIVSLNKVNQDKDPPHAIAFAQIHLTNQLTVYRIMDADHGEFELYSPTSFHTFLEKYFEFNHYQLLYCRGYLKNIDFLFEKYHLSNKIERIDSLTLSKSDRSPMLNHYKRDENKQGGSGGSSDLQSLPGLELEKRFGKYHVHI